MATATMERPMMKNLHVKDAVEVLDSSFHAADVDDEDDDKKTDSPLRRDVDFDNFASDSSLQLHAAVEATPVSHDPTCPVDDEIEAEKDPELVIVEEDDEETSTRDKTRYVTPKDFELLKVIGMGAFGKVLQVRNKQSKQIVAMKVISKRLLKRKSGYVENVKAERDIMTKIRHPFVVTMHCSFQTRDKLFIIMDFLAGGELFLRLGREGIFLEKQAAFYLAEIILALDHLHTHGVLHRDLKPENILLSASGHVCLTDFGLAKDCGGFQSEEDESKARTICGTQEYMAPEMIASKGYGRAADYWAVGVICYEMLSGSPPFTSKQGSKELFRKIMSERVKMPPGSTAAACKLLKGLLNRNVTARLGASRGTMFEIGGVAALKQADFFKGIDWEKLERMEIDPPDKLHVDNDEDLRHFHDEFTKMPLPRSVTEMSMEKAQPRRCDSDMFRGFSFVQDDFHLPNRDEEEVEKYWTQMEEDGESLSECASSKLDLNESQQEPIAAVPEKKKRPPRKRKKKKTAAPRSTSPMPSENGDCASETAPVTHRTGPAAVGAVDKKNEATTPDGQDMKSTEAATRASPKMLPELPSSRGTLKEPPKPKPPPKPKQEEWQCVGPASGKKKENARSRISSKQSSAPVSVSHTNGSIHGTTSTPQSRRQLPSTPAATTPQQPWRPAPGSWAAKTSSPSTPSRSSAPTSLRQDGTAQQRSSWTTTSTTMPPQPAKPNPPGMVSPSGDWRKHRMSPSAARSQMAPPSMESIAWPSLGDFPAMTPSSSSQSSTQPTMGNNNNNNKVTSSLSSATKGAWGRTTKK